MNREKDGALAETIRHQLQETHLCWRELLDRAFVGWEPVDQTLERIIDRVEQGK